MKLAISLGGITHDIRALAHFFLSSLSSNVLPSIAAWLYCRKVTIFDIVVP